MTQYALFFSRIGKSAQKPIIRKSTTTRLRTVQNCNERPHCSKLFDSQAMDLKKQLIKRLKNDRKNLHKSCMGA
ncbi:hypothetical protein VN12_07150 [Pirellula sp. SH-Sr6A]|nr:hypothetical protein VN12_07150 [Pirellula sp. SH-Sr6A]